MEKTCANGWCKAAFEVTDGDLALLEKISPMIAGTTYAFPPPTQCPACRMQRRLAHRNTHTLYKSTSAKSGESLLSMYAPESGFTVYSQEEWSGDWDPREFGAEVDLSRPFFEQFAAMRKRVPRFNLYNRDSENCDYVNYAPHCKSCYLIFAGWFNEECYFGESILECKNCADCAYTEKSQLCYENIDCGRNYNSLYCQGGNTTVDSAFCFDCRNVRNCIGCWNLRNKENHIFNEPASKEEIAALRTRFTSEKFLREFLRDFRARKTAQAIHKATAGHTNENASGDFLFGCKNVHHCFIGLRSQDVRYSGRFVDQKDSMDIESSGKGECVYESMSTDYAYACVGCATSEDVKSCAYCDLCFHCKDCFGCVSLRSAQYCILNKQYTKEEYEALVPKIIERMRETGEWGEYFPIALSPFGYNETLAQEYASIGEKDAHARGWRWHSDATRQPMPQTYSVPDDIRDVPEAILQEILSCETCTKNFKLIPQELAFYRRIGIPIPHSCPECRHAARMALRNPRKLWDRQCMKCQKSIQSSYAPDRPEIVYCEECYLAEVY